MRRRYNLPGPGGLEGSSQSKLLGRINMIYYVPLIDCSGPLQAELDSDSHSGIFLDIENVPFQEKYRSLYILSTQVRVNASVSRFQYHRQCQDENHLLIDVDRVVSKVMIVPHFNPEKDYLLCGVCMWDVR